MSETDQTAAAGAANRPQVAVQRVYLKDLSFESPQSPDIFRSEWKPEVKMDLGTRHREMGEDHHEVVLQVTVTVRQDDQVVFLAEVQQAGIFLLAGLDPESLRRVLGTFCPELLFPYVRELIDSVVVRGSFPPLMLAPVNFEALFMQSLEQEKAGTAQPQ